MKNFLAATGCGDKQALLALCAEDIEWIIPGENWLLADTHRGHAGVAGVLQMASKEHCQLSRLGRHVGRRDD